MQVWHHLKKVLDTSCQLLVSNTNQLSLFAEDLVPLLSSGQQIVGRHMQDSEQMTQLETMKITTVHLQRSDSLS